MLTTEEEVQLTRQAQAGSQKARDRLVLSHMPLVQSIARQTRLGHEHRQDMVCEGVTGLLISIDKFDLRKQVRFSTYARWWIRAATYQYLLRNFSMVKLGTTAIQRKLFFNLGKLQGRLGVDQGLHTLAQEIGIALSDVEEMSVRLQGDTSLSLPVVEDLARSQDPSPEDIASRRSDERFKAGVTAEALSFLNPREQIVLRQRVLCEPRTRLEDIAAKLGISNERVRQIEARALSRFKSIVDFLMREKQE